MLEFSEKIASWARYFGLADIYPTEEPLGYPHKSQRRNEGMSSKTAVAPAMSLVALRAGITQFSQAQKRPFVVVIIRRNQ